PTPLDHLFFHTIRENSSLHSFPTRRSSDLQFGHCRNLGDIQQFCEARAPLSSPVIDCDIAADDDIIVPAFDGRSEHFCCRKFIRSEEHTSELQSRENLVCRLLLEKKKKQYL